ncbi:MAG: MlaD family protein [Solirubrobacteraceae bacterium]
MSRRTHRRRPEPTVGRNAVLGLVVTLLIASVCYLIFRGPIPGQSPRELRITMRDTGAIRANAAIKLRVAGVDVGYVTNVEPLAGRRGMADVTLRITDEDLVIRRDATVKLRPRLFLEGNFFFDLKPGTPEAGELGDRPLPPSATSIHVAADEFFSIFDSSTREDLPAALAGLSGILDEGGARRLRSLLRTLPRPLASTAVVGRAVRGTEPDDLSGLIRSAAGVMDEVADRSDALRAGITQGRRTFVAFADRQDALGATIGELAEMTRRSIPDLQALSAAVPATRALLRETLPVLRGLPRTLDLASPALRAVVTTLRPGDVRRLLAAFRPAARVVSATAGPLGDALTDLRPVSRCVSRNIAPVLDAKIDDGPRSTGAPVHRMLGSLAVGAASGVSMFDANGYWLRYGVGFGNQLLSMGDGAEGNFNGGLQALTDQPPIGSVPPKPDRRPAIRPDVPCEDQARPVLTATPRMYHGSATGARPAPAAARRLLEGDGPAAERLRSTLSRLLDPEATR